jgi:D-alanyl-lipoteichoic acid acyltransferase DltB (MBOAT superfamily)
MGQSRRSRSAPHTRPRNGGTNLGTASLQFLAYACAAAILFNLSRKPAWRQGVLLLASVGFLGFFSRDIRAFVPMAAFVLLGFVGLRLMQAGATFLFAPILIVALGTFLWLKKYAFVPASLFLQHPYVTLGLSYILFRVLHLIIDSRSEYSTLPRRIGLVSYLNYTLNFTTLVAGPIQRYREFASMQLAEMPLELGLGTSGEALYRIIKGFFKVNVLSLLLSMLQATALNSVYSGPTFWTRVFAGIVVAGVYPFYLYCNFSGYIDMVIGIARFLRLRLPENFNRPFASENYIVFWSRWHITLSTWVSIYVYTPLMVRFLKRWPVPSAEPFLAAVAYFATFFLVGVWHGQTPMFIFFGFLLGLGMSVTKIYQALMTRSVGRDAYQRLGRNGLYNALARGLTFTWCAFTLVWFWSNGKQLDSIAHAMGTAGVALAWIAIFVLASLGLAAWEVARAWLLSYLFEGQPVLHSRYVRTSFATALLVIALAVVLLLNTPAPDIVYKTF